MSGNPHDVLVKAIFGNPEHMAGELRSVLPPAIVRALRFSTLTPIPGDLILRATDLAFSIRTSVDDELLMSVIVEHQSTPDRHVPDRFLDLHSLLWRQWRQQGGQGARPPIIPVLLYQGPRPWRIPQHFAHDYGLPPGADEWRSHLLDFRIFVDDLSRETDERLRARAMSDAGKLALLILRHARSTHLMDRLEQWLDLWESVTAAPSGLMAFRTLMTYIAQVNPHVDRQRLVGLIPVHAKEARDMMPTLFEREVAAGREEGRREGREEGLLVGRREMLAKQLTRRFGPLPSSAVDQLERADLATLDRWAERVLDASTLEDVLR